MQYVVIFKFTIGLEKNTKVFKTYYYLLIS